MCLGGERGVPLRLYLECEADLVQGQGSGQSYQGMCGIKVFKDKGGDRKQRQDQAKIERLPPAEQVGVVSGGYDNHIAMVTVSMCRQSIMFLALLQSSNLFHPKDVEYQQMCVICNRIYLHRLHLHLNLTGI